MNKISTVLSILALALIGLLFYFHFTHVEELKKVSSAAEKNSHNNFKIAYFDIDSLQNNYKDYKDALEKVKARESSMNAELDDLTRRYQARIKQWQDKGNTMTQAEGEAAQREYAMMQQDYEKRKNELGQQLQKQQIDLMSELRKKIEEFLKDYNKNGQYSYIFSYEPGFIYYKDSLYDITPEVIKGLNALYKEPKETKK
jgi:outer membrane protein